jgi:hypothetical protein
MFRFAIRDVLWVTVVVALGVGWWLDRSSFAVQAKHADQAKTTARILASELNSRGFEITVHPDGGMSGTGPFSTLDFK